MSDRDDLARLAAWCDAHDARTVKVDGGIGWLVRAWDYDVSSVALGKGHGDTLAEAVAACLAEDEYSPPLGQLIDAGAA